LKGGFVKKVTIGLDRDREIRYNVNALAELDERFDEPFVHVITNKTFGVANVRALLYIGLKHGGLKFKAGSREEQEDAVGNLLQEHWFDKGRTLVELMRLIGDSLNASGVFRTPEGDEEESELQADPSEAPLG